MCRLTQGLFIFLTEPLTTREFLDNFDNNEILIREVVGIFKSMVSWFFGFIAVFVLIFAIGNLLTGGRALNQLEKFLFKEEKDEQK